MAVAEFTIQRTWQSDRSSPLRWIFSHVIRQWPYLVGILIGALGNAGGASLLPVLIGQAFNGINKRVPDYATLGTVALLIVTSQLLRGVLQLGRNFSAEIIGQRLERDLRDELYASLIGKSMTFHDRQQAGDVMARATNDVREINLMMNPGVNLVVGSAAFLIFPIIFAPRLHPQLIIIPIIYVFLYGAAVWRYLGQLIPVTQRVRREFGVMNSTLAESIEGVETVKGAAQERREMDRFDKTLRNWRDAAVHQGRVESIYLPNLLLGGTVAFGILHSLLLYASGQVDIGTVISFNGLLMMFGFPTFSAQFSYSQVSSGLASARRMLELINAETKLDENAAGHDAPMQGAVAFDCVTFGYGDGKPQLEAVSFDVRPGQTVAIVGQTGSGKSSIIKLINRIYDAGSGCVRVDGVDVRDWNLAALRRQISIIEQDIFLFSRTIAENIAFGAPNATQAQIEEAARAAQAHEFIMSFKDGYQTLVGERGVTLSGGQRQRIALARAFMTNPHILVLDDSTSAIDSATEDLIQRAIFRAAQGRTTFIITHRLSQIRWADVIIVMRKGKVAAIGTHDDLMITSLVYRAIFDRGDDGGVGGDLA
ncbi:MAG: ABC transporter ATP-binding protein/permease [Chloroflexi bacterium]|nr:ABC transporter ATP-binding protein/permease [Chloroflexota bacterium]